MVNVGSFKETSASTTAMLTAHDQGKVNFNIAESQIFGKWNRKGNTCEWGKLSTDFQLISSAVM
jgi:sigma54-dependent transcription regulator